MKFNSEKEMLSFLKSYRNTYYEWLVLEASTSVKSPIFSQDPKITGYSDTSSLYNRDIIRKQELEEHMREIEDVIERLRYLNQDSYRIIYFKYIRFKNLEEIACILHYSLSHVKQSLYPKAKEELFDLIKL